MGCSPNKYRPLCCYALYSVYDRKSGKWVCKDATLREAADAVGVQIESFRRHRQRSLSTYSRLKVDMRWEPRRYSVWNERRGNLVICDATAEECCKAMGIRVTSWSSIVNKCNRGIVKRWHIEECEPLDKEV